MAGRSGATKKKKKAKGSSRAALSSPSSSPSSSSSRRGGGGKAATSTSTPTLPCVLAIGGLDPGAGAGVLADARAIGRTGAFACAAIALLTVQSTAGLRSATVVPSKELIAECMEVIKTQRIRAIKVGALGNDENAKAVGDLLAIHRELLSVVDTVMLPTRGSGRLLEERAISVLRDRVLRRATLVTVNAPEAEVLTGNRVTRLDEARDAAIALLALGSRAVLLKGGHLSGVEAIDLLVFHEKEQDKGSPVRVIEIRSPRLRLPPVHGGGCALASLIAGRMAFGHSILDAVRWSKKIHHTALANATDVGGDMRVLFT